MENVFHFNSYVDFLNSVAESKGKRGGVKTALAEAMGSHPAYLSRVLADQAHLNLEQAEKIAAFLKLESDERKYFFFLVEEARAGNAQVKKFFQDELEEIRKRRLNIKDRIPLSEAISPQDQAIYYSAWYYAAIHVLVSIKKFASENAIAEVLHLSPPLIREAISFMERIGVVQRSESGLGVGPRHLHLDKTSPLLRQHHFNWRQRAIQALDNQNEKDLRYSSVFSLSEKDASEIKDKMMGHLKEYLEQISKSPEETVYAFSFDFFSLT